jgi:hypothetical protein
MMDPEELKIENEKLEIARAQLALERRKERNTSLRFLIGVILLGVITLLVNYIISADRSRRESIAKEREVFLEYTGGIDELDYDRQLKIIDRFRSLPLLSPEIRTAVEDLLLNINKQHEAKLAKEEADAQEKAAAEAEERRKAAEAAVAAEQARLRAEAEQRRLYQEIKDAIGSSANDHPI